MKLRTIAIDKIKEKLTEEHTLNLLKNELLGIRLRQQFYWPDAEQIKEDPVRNATSTLLAVEGKKVLWIMVGALIESRLKLNKQVKTGPIGFSTEGLLDFYALHPYAIDISETPEQILLQHTVELPYNANNAESLLPGTTFQIMGKGTANLSAGLTCTKGIITSTLAMNEKMEGNFALRLIREKGKMIKVILSQVHERSRDIAFTAKIGWSFDAGDIIEHDWYKKGEERLDSLDLNKLTDALPGWANDQNLADFIKKNGIEKISDFLKGYSEFYSTIGHKSSQKQRRLTAYRFDLSNKKARGAFEGLLHLDEADTAKIASDKSSGVIRNAYNENESIDESFFHLGFPGRKLILASALRSEREGFLLYDGNIQIIRSASYARNYEGILSGKKSIKWEGLDVILNNDRSPLCYWRLLYSGHDKFSDKKEVVRFCRFAKLLGGNPINESQIAKFSWAKKLFGKKDDTNIELDLYFTGEGIKLICTASKNQIRKICFDSAATLGDIEADAPWNHHRARILMNQHLELLLDISEDNDKEKKYLQSKYNDGGWKRDLEKDARVLKIADNIINHISQITTDNSSNGLSFEKAFKGIGESARFNYMIIIATLASIAREEETLLDNLVLKMSETGKVLAMVDEKSNIISADDLFSQAAKDI